MTPASPDRRPYLVELDEYEIQMVALRAAQATAFSATHNHGERYGIKRDDSFDAVYVGMFGECAVAKKFNIYWNGNTGDLQAIDVGPFQVRASRMTHPSLLLHPTDNDHQPFICASVGYKVATLHGWAYAHQGKLQKYWRTDTGRPAWFFPFALLRPMDTLIAYNLNDELLA